MRTITKKVHPIVAIFFDDVKNYYEDVKPILDGSINFWNDYKILVPDYRHYEFTFGHHTDFFNGWVDTIEELGGCYRPFDSSYVVVRDENLICNIMKIEDFYKLCEVSES